MQKLVLGSMLAGAQAGTPVAPYEEKVAYFELGTFNEIKDDAQNIQFHRKFETPPVVLMNAITFNDEAPVTAAFGEVSTEGIVGVTLREPECNGNQHDGMEELDWMAIPAGEYETGNIIGGWQQRMKVGQTAANLVNRAEKEFQVTFDTPFESEEIVVIATIQKGSSSGSWKVARAIKANKQGFKVTVQTDEGVKKPAGWEKDAGVPQTRLHFTPDFENEDCDDCEGVVTVGWMALTTGIHEHNGFTFHARTIPALPLNEQGKKQGGIHLTSEVLRSEVGAEDPLVFASLSSKEGGDTAFVRVIKRKDKKSKWTNPLDLHRAEKGSFKVLVSEDTCFDGEQWHASESIDIVTVNRNRQWHAEFKKVEANGVAQDIPFSTSFLQPNFDEVPVIFHNPITLNDQAPVASSFTAVTTNGVQGLQLVSQQCHTGKRKDTALAHGIMDINNDVTETVDLMALRPGTYGEDSMQGGVKVGRATVAASPANNPYKRAEIQVTFDTPFASDDIAIMVSVQADGNTEWKNVRATYVSKTGFKITVNEAQGTKPNDNNKGINSGVSTDTVVGWLAMKKGTVYVDGYEVTATEHSLEASGNNMNLLSEVKMSGSVVVAVEDDATHDPMVFASIASRHGGDPAFLRIHKEVNAGEQQHRIFLTEDTCHDAEINHKAENVHVFTVKTHSRETKYANSVLSKEAFDFWELGAATEQRTPENPGTSPKYMSAGCNPFNCMKWDCDDYCTCFKEGVVRYVFDDEFYSTELEKMCPEDDSPCACE